MKVVVDLAECQNYGQCVFVAPNVFSMDPENHLLFIQNPDESSRPDVEAAVDACPFQAIMIED